MSAVTVPLVLTMLEMVSPDGTVVAVTFRLPGVLSASLTVAMVVLAAAVPCRRELPTVEMVGDVFTVAVAVAVGVNVAVAVAVAVAVDVDVAVAVGVNVAVAVGVKLAVDVAVAV